MSKFLRIFPSLFFIALLYCPAFAAGFTNPILKFAGAGCTAENLRAERFTSETGADERVKLCLAIDKITDKLNRNAWSPALSHELESIWQVFSDETVALRPMPKNTSSKMLAMAEAFPAGIGDGTGRNYAACVYVRAEKSENKSFFQVLFHELRHVFDFYDTWKNKTSLNSLEIERRAFVLMGKITQETPEKEKFSNVPKFWKESWRKSSGEEIAAKRVAAIDKYLFGSKYYRNLAQDAGKRTLDFSYLKTAGSTISQAQYANGVYDKKGGERLPVRASLPATGNILPQNIRDVNLNLEKPKNARDSAEILRVAIANERKLYYGMSNFVYDQKLAFQCWQKGKVSASVDENSTVARTEKGNVLFQNAVFQPNAAATSCALDSQNLKTDFTETFWASPALEKMPINFVGFVQVEGKTLARYTVLQPNEQLFNQIAGEFPNIKPFRVFVGTIFVSPEDGQIVRFWGTSFPEDNVTGKHGGQKVWGSYSVTALRQKLNIDSGLWVTVYVGTVAVANVSGNSRPFSYTVKFENYRQSTTDVRVLDDDTAAAATTEVVRANVRNNVGMPTATTTSRDER
ncbi:MAG: hypothetical protein H0U87_06870 [Acidobacteria bacterium]|nr:hypothetical protein [Acidobacteriota bacterium]